MNGFSLAMLAVLSAACFEVAQAGAPANPAEAPGRPLIPPREAGARYGQGLGVALICYGLRTTPAFEQLPSQYGGQDRAAFDAETEKVLAAWREASTCKKAGGPNACRLIHEWSCSAAVREIGPQGTVLPGLIEANTPKL